MGKGPKYNSNKSRNNPIFKVVGVKDKDKKGRAKEVVSKLKMISSKNRSKVLDLDDTLKQIQHTSVLKGQSISGVEKTSQAIAVAPVKAAVVKDAEMSDLANLLEANS